MRVPRDRAPDATLALLREGYAFVGERCDRLGTDLFRTRLMMQPTICMRGRECAELLYDPTLFVRKGAQPRRLRATLLGDRGVQSLDGDAHVHRKAMFLQVFAPDRVAALASRVAAGWEEAAARWEGGGDVVLLDAASELLCRAVCDWAGVPLAEDEVSLRTRDLRATIEGGGGLASRYFRGRMGRERSERWCADLTRRVRSGRLQAEPRSALRQIAEFREADGRMLPPEAAADELLNVLRPTTAVAFYVAFAALALHQHPDHRASLARSDDLLRPFVQEVRRFYPFFPFVAARTRKPFTWHGWSFPANVRVLLDVYGTNHDPRIWDEPDQFLPVRFVGRKVGPFDLVAQGGGDLATGHRCAGEALTIALLEVSVAFLARSIRYEVPEQDLTVRLSRMPARPESGLVLRDVRRVAAESRAA